MQLHCIVRPWRQRSCNADLLRLSVTFGLDHARVVNYNVEQ